MQQPDLNLPRLEVNTQALGEVVFVSGRSELLEERTAALPALCQAVANTSANLQANPDVDSCLTSFVADADRVGVMRDRPRLIAAVRVRLREIRK
jgi:hypothetical protein